MLGAMLSADILGRIGPQAGLLSVQQERRIGTRKVHDLKLRVRLKLYASIG